MRRLLACILLTLFAGAATAADERVDAVFVLGTDARPDDRFFAAATQYFAERRRPDDLLVTTARTWSEVREMLARSPQRGPQPWGRVVIVAHGSQWTGLAVPVFAREPAPRTSGLDALIASQVFPALPDDVFDARSILMLESCGIGRRPDLLQRYAMLLGGPDAPAATASSGLVEFIAPQGDADAPARRIEHDYQTAVLRAPSRADTRDEAANGAHAGWTRIPVSLAVPMNDARCDVRQPARLARAKPVQAALHDHGLRLEQLRWSLSPTSHGACELVGAAEIRTSSAATITRIDLRPGVARTSNAPELPRR